MNIQYNMKIQDYLPITLGVKSLDFKHMHNRVMHFELNLMEHSNLWISRALDLIEGGRSLIFAVGFKSSPRKTCDGRPD